MKMKKKFKCIVLVDKDGIPLSKDKQYYNDDILSPEIRKAARKSGKAFKKAFKNE